MRAPVSCSSFLTLCLDEKAVCRFPGGGLPSHRHCCVVGAGGTEGSVALWLGSIRSKCRALADLKERLVALGRASADKLAPGQEAKTLGSVLKQVSSLLWASVFSFSMHRNHACLSAGLSHRKALCSAICLCPRQWWVVFIWA